ncbi:proline dehydrogenase [Shouchella clausii]|uniref:proline dehydrogenase n=2 Tax=Shouchella TaxID=2893057 RepID=A0A268NY11_SHOCL|nr:MULTISPECIES: proline dehydrogenase [Shouchella]MCM3381190.1 proline dehydrogenase [Shouchella rhizosphaerae]MDO7269430.1 proline dehydrogenase [Shouchella clausii]MDO7289312.1 proline dehydrogenase [Shouchella clausii]PAD46506.1 proline dehydrogenase [Shouchella clausii]PAE80428.1 proline dehydrogenase [Shouchella clausii]
MVLDQPLRSFFMQLAKSKPLNKAAKKWGLKFGARQFVAGQTLEEAMATVIDLNNKGLVCTLDHLGEFVTEEQEALDSTEACLDVLRAINETGADCNLSVKLTQLGLDIDESFCLKNMKRIVQTARSFGIFVRIDMEDYAHCEQTLRILEKLRNEYDGVGTVIQAYLHRAEEDVRSLKGVPLRLVKGAYKESAEVALQEKALIDENYFNIIRLHLDNGSYTAIASHDHHIIEKVKTYAAENRIPKSQFEFQMLYGFRETLQKELLEQGYKVRLYVPFGTDWFGYFMRRLAERPQNIAFALRGFFSK